MSTELDLQQIAQGLHDAEVKESAPPPVLIEPSSTPAPVYSPALMVQLMIDHPDWSHSRFAAHFGRQPSWMAAVLASDMFQRALDGRRHEVADPSLAATLDERFRALAIRSTTVLSEKLNLAGVNDLTVLKAAELGVKALGLGLQPKELPAPTGEGETASERVMRKILEAQARNRGEVVDVVVKDVPNGE